MNTETTMPASARRFTAFFRVASLATISRPPSVVISWRPSGTSIAISGLMRPAICTISAVAAISRLRRMWVSSRRRRTSSSWMWRRSSRRWTVMPSAPPRCASTAAQTGSGSYVRRAWRTVATWSTLTPSSIIEARSQVAQFSQDRARVQALADQRAHEVPCLLARLRAGVVVGGHVEQGPAPHHRQVAAGTAHHRGAALGLVGIEALRVDRPARSVAVEDRRVPELGEQTLFEPAQDDGGIAGAAQAGQGFPIGIEQRLVRIVARQQPQHELVQVEPAHERASREGQQRARPFGRDQVAELRRSTPGDAQGLEREQHAAHRRARPSRPPREQRHAPEAPREQLDDEARLL